MENHTSKYQINTLKFDERLNLLNFLKFNQSVIKDMSVEEIRAFASKRFGRNLTIYNIRPLLKIGNIEYAKNKKSHYTRKVSTTKDDIKVMLAMLDNARAELCIAKSPEYQAMFIRYFPKENES